MAPLLALAISIGIVSGGWMVIAYLLGLTGISALAVAAWPAFVGMPLYFAGGGGRKGLAKTIAATSCGAAVSILMVLIGNAMSFLGEPWPIAIGVGLGSFLVVMYSKLDMLSYIPGGFGGCASAFGVGVGTDVNLLVAVIIALASGAILGYTADVWAKKLIQEPATTVKTTSN